ncbi:uncharacterized protein LOC144118531 isoform X1 [Amblyomma americanum]
MDTSLKRIIDVQLVQSNEVLCSSAMELEGLKRVLKVLDSQKVRVIKLVTDRHTQVRSHLLKERPDVPHCIDAWHVAKGLKKKLQAVSRSRGCDLIGKWVTSIINHLYFSVKTGAGRGTDAFIKLRVIVENSRLLIDIKQVSASCQTSSVESFHSLVNRLALKSFTFSFYGMLARYESIDFFTYASAIHLYNSVLDVIKGGSNVSKIPTLVCLQILCCPCKKYQYI